MLRPKWEFAGRFSQGRAWVSAIVSGLRRIRKSYKRECQETFFPPLAARMLSCIQPPTPRTLTYARLIVLDLAQQQRSWIPIPCGFMPVIVTTPWASED